VEELTDEIMALGGGKGSALGTGGMATKLGAAKICIKSGMNMAIINGSKPEALYDLTEGKSAGTMFVGKKA
jgi:glutamate 5-kinase